jgi:uncharacterized repeat protein (TIGR03803 family)
MLSSSRIYAAVCSLVCLATAAQAHRFDVLYAFQGGTDGWAPEAGVVFDHAGNMYGTTELGGGTGCGGNGCGTVFKLATDGTETILHAFAGGNDGAFPQGSLIIDAAGAVYGTTDGGGGAGCGGNGCGTVFKIAANTEETILYAFTGGADGGYPVAGLLADKKGNLFGTTEGGGAFEYGTVFEIGADGAESVLYAFCSLPDCADGADPSSTLVADAKGNLYGTTQSGGDGSGGWGTVFEVQKSGKERVIYNFCSQVNEIRCPDGSVPVAGVTMDKSGNLYGTTESGGAANVGTVFVVAPNGTETVIHSFLSNPDNGDGILPVTPVLLDAMGNLYGTAHDMHLQTCAKKPGVVYKLAPDGTETLYCTQYVIDGGVVERNGFLYGTGDWVYSNYPHGNVFKMKK